MLILLLPQGMSSIDKLSTPIEMGTVLTTVSHCMES